MQYCARSSYEVSRDLGITQNTAWFKLQRLRLVLKSKHIGTKLGSNDGGEVEVNESFVTAIWMSRCSASTIAGRKAIR